MVYFGRNILKKISSQIARRANFMSPTSRRHGATKDLRAAQCETVAELTAPATHRGGAAWPALSMEVEMLGPRGFYKNNIVIHS